VVPATVPNKMAAFAEFSNQPIVQAVPAIPEAAVAPQAPVARAAAKVAVRPAAVRRAANGNHAVQLGSFSSQQGARRAWGIFAARNPTLKSYHMVITPAVVRGQNFWRVAAAGFDGGSARSMCSTVKRRGGVFFADATAPARAVNPAAPGRSAAGPAFARRR
jgi:hypothetical protein